MLDKRAVFLFIVLHIIKANGEQEPLRVFAPDYHGVIVKVQKIKTSWCSAKIAGRHLDDFVALSTAGWKIFKKEVMRREKLTLTSVLIEAPELEKYEDEIYECIKVLEEPNEEMIDFLKQLKKRGIKLVLASNIHTESFEINRSKLKPELFELFDFYHIANEKNGKKPHPDYYRKLRKRMNKKLCKNDEECINTMKAAFTDDLQENIDGSDNAHVGIEAVHFKNVDDLKRQLCTSGFLYEEECTKESN